MTHLSVVRGSSGDDDAPSGLSRAGQWPVEKSKTLPEVRQADAQTKSAVPDLLARTATETAELSYEKLPKMRESVHITYRPTQGRLRKLLLPYMREVRKSDQEESFPCNGLSDMLQTIQQISSVYSQEQGKIALLQPVMLVQLQPEEQSLSLERRAEREDEPRRG